MCWYHISRFSNLILAIAIAFFFESCSSDSYQFSKEAIRMADSLCDCFTDLSMNEHVDSQVNMRDSCYSYMNNVDICPTCVYVYGSGNPLNFKPHQRDSIMIIYIETLVLADSFCWDDNRGKPFKMIDLKGWIDNLAP